MIKRKGFGVKRKPKKRKRVNVDSVSFLMKRLDKLVSIHVRISRANMQGMVQCYTCDKWFEIKKIQNGHYVSRFYKSVRWNLDNCRPQCMWCNMFKNGDAANYRERLIQEIGEERVKRLEEARKISQKLDPCFLKEQIEHYIL